MVLLRRSKSKVKPPEPVYEVKCEQCSYWKQGFWRFKTEDAAWARANEHSNTADHDVSVYLVYRKRLKGFTLL